MEAMKKSGSYIKMDILVQFFNLPLGYLSKIVGQCIGNHIGDFKEYDEMNN